MVASQRKGKAMALTMRSYRDDEDYWRIREFLRRVTLLNGLRDLSWPAMRWDYWWWFGNPHLEHLSLTENVFLWERQDGQVAAVLNPEQPGQVFLQVHPADRSPELEEEMIALAEQRLARTRKDGRRALWLWADSKDEMRHEILARRGFGRVDRPGEAENQHRRWLDGPLPESPLIPGYTVRSQGDGLELLERCYASGLGFHDDIKIAQENRDDPGWYRGMQSAPLYRRDLDLVAVAADGSIASFCTVWFDDVTRTAHCEPVATVPAHRRRGLARAVIIEGLHRVKRLGAKTASVSGYSEEANKLYFSVMGSEFDVCEPWEKVL
jgi:GNAT superfamily N-acetyltransferase